MTFNKDAIKEVAHHVEQIMRIIGIEETESTKDTPQRVAKMYLNEVFANVNRNEHLDLAKEMTKFKNEVGEQLIIIKDIPFYSMCEHHLMPFSGKITVGYVPRKHIIGLSKIPRVVKFFSKRPQLQERLVQDIARFLYQELDPKAILVLGTDCVHTCVTARGIETYCETDTLHTYGALANDFKAEFLQRVQK